MNRPPLGEIRRTSEAVANYKSGSENEPGAEARSLAFKNIALLDYIAFLEKGFEELASRCRPLNDALYRIDGEAVYINTLAEPNAHAAVSQAKERLEGSVREAK